MSARRAALAALGLTLGCPGLAAGVPQDSLPVVTLGQAIREATSLDPGYVAAVGRMDNAAWARRAAVTAFIVPSIDASTSYTRSSTPFFNVGTAELTDRLVQGQLQASLNVFDGGRKFVELGRSKAEVEAAAAGELQALYQTALDTEADYYDVLAAKELVVVARERVRRAEEQLQVARARVISGAAVQTDSLQLLLELDRARVDVLRQETALRVSRFQLARRVGAAGPVDAAPLDTTAAPDLPLTESEAIAEAIAGGPDYRLAVADEREAQAFLDQQRLLYLPSINLFGQLTAFDDQFFPSAVTRNLFGLQLSWPLWNGAQREIQISRARVDRDVARTRREDTEREVRRDVAQAYAAYNTARASARIAAEAVLVARENLRVQDSRYRSGATTILDLLTAQVDLTDAEAALVQARYATRLALAGLEALIGRRLFPDGIQP